MSDWIAWNGGEWDGDDNLLVYVRFADGLESINPALAGDIRLNWKMKSSYQWDTSIIAYRHADA